MRARTVLTAVGAVGLLLGTMAAVAPPAAAATIIINWSNYPAYTTIDKVSVPGVTFIAADPSKAVVINDQLWVEGVDGVDLTIRVTDGTAFSTFYNGTDTCQISGYDVLGLSLAGTSVDSFTTFEGLEGRCSSGTYARTLPYDEFSIDIATGQKNRLSALVLDAYAPPTGDDSAPATIIQGVPAPASGSCDAIADATYSYGVAGLTGGWTHSWAQWADDGRGGDICTRTLTYSDAAGRWVVAA